MPVADRRRAEEEWRESVGREGDEDTEREGNSAALSAGDISRGRCPPLDEADDGVGSAEPGCICSAEVGECRGEEDDDDADVIK